MSTTCLYCDWKKQTRVVQCVELGSSAVVRYFIQVKVYGSDFPHHETIRWIECYSDNCYCPSFESKKTCIQRLDDWWWVPGYFTYDMQTVVDEDGDKYDIAERINGYCGPETNYIHSQIPY